MENKSMKLEALRELEGKIVHVCTKAGKKFKGTLATVGESHIKIISPRYGISFIENDSIESINQGQEEGY